MDKTMTTIKIKQIAVIILEGVIMFVTCGADSIGPINVGIIYAICYLLWRVFKLKEVFPNDKE